MSTIIFRGNLFGDSMRTIVEVGEALRTKKLSPVELTRHCLARIAQCNPSLNAFITVTPELALQQARQAEEEIMRGGWRGPLHGIPLGLKDLIDTAGIATTAASELYKHRIPIQHAEVVRKLEQAGAVVLGKHNLHEFAYGGSSLVSCFGEVRNPWKPTHIAGGSSGGSAAAVAAGPGSRVRPRPRRRGPLLPPGRLRPSTFRRPENHGLRRLRRSFVPWCSHP